MTLDMLNGTAGMAQCVEEVHKAREWYTEETVWSMGDAIVAVASST
jgi:hypothetical protein